ncbi:MAG: aldo/keto reductase [Terriglobia bacterium]
MNAIPEYFRTLGATGMYCHPLGFGGYRVVEGNPEHEAALRLYLERGGNLIDTSANYGNGESERLIGRVLSDFSRDEYLAITKAGYIQGLNMEIARTRGFPEIVPYAEGIWHCIHPEYLQTQIEGSQKRLQLEQLDVLLLHNPEYFLNHQAHLKELDASDYDEFYRRIREAFRFLEEKVQEGAIRFYGVSSNNFGLPAADPTMTSVSRCLAEAETVSSTHHFHIVQLPLNLVESGGALERNNEGNTVLGFCQQHGIGVLANRPLNAFSKGKVIRLADFAKPGERPPGKRELQELLRPLREHEQLLGAELQAAALDGRSAGLAQMLEQLVSQAKSLDQWNLMMNRYVVPPLKRWINESSNHQSHPILWNSWLEKFLQLIQTTADAAERFIQLQHQPQSDRIRSSLYEAGYPQTSDSLSQMTLSILLNLEGLSSVLNGMRRPSYVADALGSQLSPRADSVAILRDFKGFL